MAALTQTRALNPRAFTVTYGKPSRKAFQPTNGTRWTMKRKDSYMVEVELAEDETEDSAVRRYLKAVVQSGVIDQLRARRRKESKVEEYKRKLQARAQARRLGIVEPTWEECYGPDEESRPFEEYFRYGEYEDPEVFGQGADYMYGLNQNSFAYGNRGFAPGGFNPAQGGYLPNAGQGGYNNMAQGGYIDDAQGGYMGQQAGFVADQGGDVNAAAQQQMQEGGGFTRPQELPVETYNFSSEPQQQQQ